MKKLTPEEMLSEITGIPVYRLLANDSGEYIKKSVVLQAMKRYAEQEGLENNIDINNAIISIKVVIDILIDDGWEKSDSIQHLKNALQSLEITPTK
jgi:hypothetical protein